MNPVLNLALAVEGAVAGGTMNIDMHMAVGDPPRLFRVTPTGPVGEVVAWPDAGPVMVLSTVPSVAQAVVGQDPHTAVVTPLAPGTALVSISAANCTSYINVTVRKPVTTQLSLESV